MSQEAMAADQATQLALKSLELILRSTGEGTKHSAVIIAALARWGWNYVPTEGEISMRKITAAHRATNLFTIRNMDKEAFIKGAKEFELHYAVLADSEIFGDTLEIVVGIEDVDRFNRIAEKYGLNVVRNAQIESAAINSFMDKGKALDPENPDPKAVGEIVQDFYDAIQFEDEPESVVEQAQEQENTGLLFDEGDATQEGEEQAVNPPGARMVDGSDYPSEPSLLSPSDSDRSSSMETSSTPNRERVPIVEQLREVQAILKDRQVPDVRHIMPQLFEKKER